MMSKGLFALLLLAQPVSGFLLKKDLPKSGRIINIATGILLLPVFWLLKNDLSGLDGLGIVLLVFAPISLLAISVLLGNGVVAFMVKTKHSPTITSYAPTAVVVLLIIWMILGYATH